MVGTLTLYGTPEASSVVSPTLAYVSILLVKREGLQYNSTAAAPVNREYIFDPAAGSISFDPTIPFAGRVLGGRPIPQSEKEKIFIIYEV